MLTRRNLIQLLILISALCVSAYAQTESSSVIVPAIPITATVTAQDDLRTQAEMAAEIRLLRAEKAGWTSERAALTGERDAWRKTAEVNEKVAGIWERIATKSERVGTIEDERVADCRLQLQKADAEIHRLRYPSIFKQLFSPDTLFKVGVGFAAGKAIK